MEGSKRRIRRMHRVVSTALIGLMQPKATVGSEYVRLQYQRDSNDPAVLFGYEIFVKMRPSVKHKIKVRRA